MSQVYLRWSYLRPEFIQQVEKVLTPLVQVDDDEEVEAYPDLYCAIVHEVQDANSASELSRWLVRQLDRCIQQCLLEECMSDTETVDQLKLFHSMQHELQQWSSETT